MPIEAKLLDHVKKLLFSAEIIQNVAEGRRSSFIKELVACSHKIVTAKNSLEASIYAWPFIYEQVSSAFDIQKNPSCLLSLKGDNELHLASLIQSMLAVAEAGIQILIDSRRAVLFQDKSLKQQMQLRLLVTELHLLFMLKSISNFYIGTKQDDSVLHWLNKGLLFVDRAGSNSAMLNIWLAQEYHRQSINNFCILGTKHNFDDRCIMHYESALSWHLLQSNNLVSKDYIIKLRINLIVNKLQKFIMKLIEDDTCCPSGNANSSLYILEYICHISNKILQGDEVKEKLQNIEILLFEIEPYLSELKDKFAYEYASCVLAKVLVNGLHARFSVLDFTTIHSFIIDQLTSLTPEQRSELLVMSGHIAIYYIQLKSLEYIDKNRNFEAAHLIEQILAPLVSHPYSVLAIVLGDYKICQEISQDKVVTEADNLLELKIGSLGLTQGKDQLTANIIECELADDIVIWQAIKYVGEDSSITDYHDLAVSEHSLTELNCAIEQGIRQTLDFYIAAYNISSEGGILAHAYAALAQRSLALLAEHPLCQGNPEALLILTLGDQKTPLLPPKNNLLAAHGVLLALHTYKVLCASNLFLAEDAEELNVLDLLQDKAAKKLFDICTTFNEEPSSGENIVVEEDLNDGATTHSDFAPPRKLYTYRFSLKA